jgi:hypothetical protein
MKLQVQLRSKQREDKQAPSSFRKALGLMPAEKAGFRRFTQFEQAGVGNCIVDFSLRSHSLLILELEYVGFSDCQSVHPFSRIWHTW